MKEELKGELDGFFGLFVDNLLQFVLIFVLCKNVCGMPREFILGTILPGAAISILLGNLFYSREAKELAKREGREDVTALPYGINTVSLIAFVFLIMLPVYSIEQDWNKAWRVSLVACFASGVIELSGALVGGYIRRMTPRGALLSSLAGIALTFISMGFVFRIFAFPLVALVPALLIIIGYCARVRLPFGMPVGLFSLLTGAVLFWTFRLLGFAQDIHLVQGVDVGIFFPSLHVSELFSEMANYNLDSFVAIVLPMGLFNVIGSLQNLESAESAGDEYNTARCLGVNGIGTVIASFLGSPFPTTIYIGHPGWKAMGAKWRYSVWNGVTVFVLAVLGLTSSILALLPMESMVGILLWIGLVMVVQSFRDVPRKHYFGVVLGLIPSLAAWALMLIETTARTAGKSLFSIREALMSQDIFLDGIIGLNQGFIISSSILAAVVIFASERDFLRASCWCLVAGFFSWFGIIHGFSLSESGVKYAYKWCSAPEFAFAYWLSALIFFILRRQNQEEQVL